MSKGPDFYTKFAKPSAKSKPWMELTPDEMAYDPNTMTRKLGGKSGKTTTAQPQPMDDEDTIAQAMNQDPSVVKAMTGYDFALSNDEAQHGQEPVKDITAPSNGIFGYLKQKGEQAYAMINPTLTNLVKHFEGLRTSAYLPTKNDVPTIGYGMTKGVKIGDTITPEEADKQLQEHLTEYQNQVKSMVKVPLTDNQLNALTSLVYNIGPTAFRKSKALTALNAEDFDTFQHEAFDPKHGFVHQDGEILTGLVNRRQKEKELFNS